MSLRFATAAEIQTLMWVLNNNIPRPPEIDDIDLEIKAKTKEAAEYLGLMGVLSQEKMEEILKLQFLKEEIYSKWISKMTTERQ